MTRLRTEPVRHFPTVFKTLAQRLTILHLFRALRCTKPQAYASSAVCSLSLYIVAYSYEPTLYRPTCASVLSGHIDSVTVAAIICHAPGFEALRVIVVCLHRTTDHASQDCSRQTPSQAAYLLRFLLLTNVLFCILLPLPPVLYASYVCSSRNRSSVSSQKPAPPCSQRGASYPPLTCCTRRITICLRKHPPALN